MSSVSAGASSPIKSIQRGVRTNLGGWTELTVSPVNMSKSIIIINQDSNLNTSSTLTSAFIKDSTTIRFQEWATGGTSHWELIEYV